VSKKKRAIGAGRMTPATIAAVIAEIEAYGRGERDAPLSWAHIAAFSGFSHVSLWKKPSIKAAFQKVHQTQRTNATPVMKAPRTTDERIIAMQLTIEELRGLIQRYDEQWALYEHNVHRLGIDPEELRKPLDPVERQLVRSRRVRSVC
jgi:hypothetical protein